MADPEYFSRVHLAGSQAGGRQACIRCGYVLSEGGPGWPVGGLVAVVERRDGHPTNPTSLYRIEHRAPDDDEIPCRRLN